MSVLVRGTRRSARLKNGGDGEEEEGSLSIVDAVEERSPSKRHSNKRQKKDEQQNDEPYAETSSSVHTNGDVTELKKKRKSKIDDKNEQISTSPRKNEQVSTSPRKNEQIPTSPRKSSRLAASEMVDTLESMSKTTETASGATGLMQALSSGDRARIDAILSRSDARSMAITLRDLPPVHVIPLLKQLQLRLTTSSALDMRSWMRWLHCAISMHMSLLTSAVGVDDQLNGLFTWMNRRCSHTPRLIALQGKLTLVTDQMHRRANPDAYIAQPPAILFQDESSSESEGDSPGDDQPTARSGESSENEDDWWDEADESGALSDNEEGDSDSGEGAKKKKKKRRRNESSSSNEEEDDDEMEED